MPSFSLGMGRVDEVQDPDEYEIPQDEGPELDPDPRPARRTRGSERKGKSAAPPPRVTAKIRAEIRDSVALLCDIPALGAAGRHGECCLPVYEETSERIHDRITAIICKRPAAVAFMTGGGEFMDILALLMALKPLGKAIWHNHMGPESHSDEDHVGGVIHDLPGHYPAPAFARG